MVTLDHNKGRGCLLLIHGHHYFANVGWCTPGDKIAVLSTNIHIWFCTVLFFFSLPAAVFFLAIRTMLTRTRKLGGKLTIGNTRLRNTTLAHESLHCTQNKKVGASSWCLSRMSFSQQNSIKADLVIIGNWLPIKRSGVQARAPARCCCWAFDLHF